MATKTNTRINNKDYYRVTVDLGRDSNGKRIRKQFYGKSKREAENKKLEFLEKYNSGITDKKLYMGETMHKWLFEVVKTGDLKDSSFDKYEGIYRNYFKDSSLSIMPIEAIQPLDIQMYYNKLFKAGKSSNVIKNAHKLLKQFFQYCEDSNYIYKNPTSGKKVTIPVNKDNDIKNKEVEIFTEDEMRIILNSSENSFIRYAALISFATGMRRGEILGLKESDINYKNNEISIQRTVVTASRVLEDGKRKKMTYLSTPKSKSSNRVIPLQNELVPILKKAILLKKEMVLKGVNLNPEYKDFIFISKDGNLINASNFEKSWIYFLKRHEIAHKKFHSLRHTYATMQFESRTPVKTVSALLGHSSIDVTLDIYTHVLKKEKEKAIDTLQLLSK